MNTLLIFLASCIIFCGLSYSPLLSCSSYSQISVTGWFWPRPWWTPCRGRPPRCASRTWGKGEKKKNHSKTEGDDHQKWTYKTSYGFYIILGYPLLISPPQCQGRMWHRCWGGHSEASVLAAFGRAPQWQRASGETAGADRPPNRYTESVCTPEPVSGCCCRPQLYWTLVLYFPGE